MVKNKQIIAELQMPSRQNFAADLIFREVTGDLSKLSIFQQILPPPSPVLPIPVWPKDVWPKNFWPKITWSKKPVWPKDHLRKTFQNSRKSPGLKLRLLWKMKQQFVGFELEWSYLIHKLKMTMATLTMLLSPVFVYFSKIIDDKPRWLIVPKSFET